MSSPPVVYSSGASPLLNTSRWSIFVQPRLFSSLMILAIFSGVADEHDAVGLLVQGLHDQGTEGDRVRRDLDLVQDLDVRQAFRPVTCASAIPGHGP